MASGMTDYLKNKFWDWYLRGQTLTPPATVYAALFTASPTNAGGGTECSGGSYARVAITSSLANWAGTQSAGSTTASSGSSGTTSNNNAITFPSPSANWGTTVALGLFDASSGGNLLWYGVLTTPRAVNNGDAAPSFAAAFIQLLLSN
jgi:hypothetical protein